MPCCLFVKWLSLHFEFTHEFILSIFCTEVCCKGHLHHLSCLLPFVHAPHPFQGMADVNIFTGQKLFSSLWLHVCGLQMDMFFKSTFNLLTENIVIPKGYSAVYLSVTFCSKLSPKCLLNISSSLQNNSISKNTIQQG